MVDRELKQMLSSCSIPKYPMLLLGDMNKERLRLIVEHGTAVIENLAASTDDILKYNGDAIGQIVFDKNDCNSMLDIAKNTHFGRFFVFKDIDFWYDQSILLKFIEDLKEGWAVYITATSEDRLLPAIKSRCYMFDMKNTGLLQRYVRCTINIKTNSYSDIRERAKTANVPEWYILLLLAEELIKKIPNEKTPEQKKLQIYCSEYLKSLHTAEWNKYVFPERLRLFYAILQRIGANL